VRVPTATTGVATVAVPFVNAGFDAGNVSGWTVVSGSASAKTANTPLAPQAGSHFLEGNSVAAFEVSQTVDVTDETEIDAGHYVASFACYRANGATDTADQGRVIVDLLDAAGAVLATILNTGPESFDPSGLWHLRSVASAAVPAGTRRIRVRFLGQRINGTVCNAALDTVSASFTNPVAPLKGSAVSENRVYRCITAGTTAAEQPAYDKTIGAETVDGTAVVVAENAWSRAGTVLEVLDRAVFTAVIDEPRAAPVESIGGWFDGGVLTWETGDNAGRATEVKSWARASGEITLFLPPGYPIRPGDAFRVHPGCDKRLDTCVTRFANVLNFRGEPDVRYQAGEMLPGGLKAIHTPGPEHAHYAFWRERSPSALFCPDLIMHEADGELAFIPAEYHDDPKATRDSVRRLLDFPFEILCLDHGTPVTADPHAALRKLLPQATPISPPIR
jgi:hypothetical protein